MALTVSASLDSRVCDTLHPKMDVWVVRDVCVCTTLGECPVIRPLV